MASRGVFAGSKRAARQQAAEAKEATRVKRELQDLYVLSKYIRDEAQLQAVLSEIEGPNDRANVESLLRRFVLFPPPESPTC